MELSIFKLIKCRGYKHITQEFLNGFTFLSFFSSSTRLNYYLKIPYLLIFLLCSSWISFKCNIFCRDLNPDSGSKFRWWNSSQWSWFGSRDILEPLRLRSGVLIRAMPRSLQQWIKDNFVILFSCQYKVCSTYNADYYRYMYYCLSINHNFTLSSKPAIGTIFLLFE